jgi:hypothetical protein
MPLWTGTGWTLTRHGVAVALSLLLLPAAAHASDSVTINTSEAYVDPSVAAEFVTVPTLCTEPIGSQGTSATACNALGDAAIAAINRTGPDVYWESSGTPLATTNAFVPGNSGSAVNLTGYAPLFSDHKYDLFGRADEFMGVLSRREIYLLELIGSDGGITTGQTVPGDESPQDIVIRALIAPEGASSFVQTGETFDIADLPIYERITGFTTGKLTTITTWCNNQGYPAVICAIPEVAGLLYLGEFFPDVLQDPCTSALDPNPSLANCQSRDRWLDQVVAGYVQSWESLGGDLHFAQNFRSQVGYDGTSEVLAANTEVWTDFRMQQSVELSGAFTTEASDPGDLTTPGDNLDGIAGRQTFEQAIATESLANLGFLRTSDSIGQLVSQDVEGYLFTCLNCDTPDLVASGAAHAFEPDKLDLTFMEYDAGWNTVPTVVHSGP